MMKVVFMVSVWKVVCLCGWCEVDLCESHTRGGNHASTMQGNMSL